MAAMNACEVCKFAECVCARDEEELEEEESDLPNPLKRSYATMGQPRSCSVCDTHPCVCEGPEVIAESEGENEEILHVNEKYQKRFKQKLICSEEYSPEPDLRVYFEGFHLSEHQQIAMCRTFANYLTQKLRSSGKMAAARPKYTKK